MKLSQTWCFVHVVSILRTSTPQFKALSAGQFLTFYQYEKRPSALLRALYAEKQVHTTNLNILDEINYDRQQYCYLQNSTCNTILGRKEDEYQEPRPGIGNVPPLRHDELEFLLFTTRDDKTLMTGQSLNLTRPVLEARSGRPKGPNWLDSLRLSSDRLVQSQIEPQNHDSYSLFPAL